MYMYRFTGDHSMDMYRFTGDYYVHVQQCCLYLEISSRGGKIKVSRNKGGQAQLDVKSSK